MLTKKQRILAVGLVAALAVPVCSTLIKNDDMVTTFHAATQMQTTDNLNVRKGAGTNYAKVATLSKGTKVSVSSVKNGWAYITYNGNKKGYVSYKYLKNISSSSNNTSSTSSSKKLYRTIKSEYGYWDKASAKSTTIKASSANVRSGMSTSTSVVDTLKKGTKVYYDLVARNSDGNWYMIRYNVNNTGYNYGYVHQSVLNV